MQGLLQQLSTAEPNAINALQVIDYFDRLTSARATPAAIVRAAAGLADCSVGVQTPGQPMIRATSTGRKPDPFDDTRVTLSVALDAGGLVWIERDGTPFQLDRLLLERLALAFRTATDPAAGGPAAALDTLLHADAGSSERLRALHSLGYTTNQRFTVIALRPAADKDATSAVLDHRLLRLLPRTTIGPVTVVLATAVDPDALRTAFRATHIHAGISAAVEWLQIPAADEHARLALRFARASVASRDRVTESADLGGLRHLAHVDSHDLLVDPLITQIALLAAEPHGPRDIAVLETYCREGSLRRAAAVLHMHHSSLPAHLARAADRLNKDVNDADARFAIQIALIVYRLAISA